MRKIIWISGTAATIIALTGAGLYFRRQIGLLLDFCYKITDFNVIYFNNTGISFSLKLNVRNQLVAYYLTNKNKLIFKITGALSVKAFYIPVKDHNVTMQYTLAELLTPNASLSTCKI